MTTMVREVDNRDKDAIIAFLEDRVKAMSARLKELEEEAARTSHDQS